MPLLRFYSEDEEIEVEYNKSLLSIDEDYSTPLLFGCMQGNCGTCKIKVIANGENLSPMEELEKTFLASIDAKLNERLGCQCRVLGDVVIEVADFGSDEIFN